MTAPADPRAVDATPGAVPVDPPRTIEEMSERMKALNVPPHLWPAFPHLHIAPTPPTPGALADVLLRAADEHGEAAADLRARAPGTFGESTRAAMHVRAAVHDADAARLRAVEAALRAVPGGDLRSVASVLTLAAEHIAIGLPMQHPHDPVLAGVLTAGATLLRTLSPEPTDAA